MLSFIPFSFYPFGIDVEFTDPTALLLDSADVQDITFTNYGWWALDAAHLLITHNVQVKTCKRSLYDQLSGTITRAFVDWTVAADCAIGQP